MCVINEILTTAVVVWPALPRAGKKTLLAHCIKIALGPNDSLFWGVSRQEDSGVRSKG